MIYKFNKKQWKRYFYKVCRKSWGFNLKATKELFEWGDGGYNWFELHLENSYYADYSLEDLIKLFDYEFEYCKTHGAIDRLLRTHWAYNMIMLKLNDL